MSPLDALIVTMTPPIEISDHGIDHAPPGGRIVGGGQKVAWRMIIAGESGSMPTPAGIGVFHHEVAVKLRRNSTGVACGVMRRVATRRPATNDSTPMPAATSTERRESVVMRSEPKVADRLLGTSRMPAVRWSPGRATP